MAPSLTPVPAPPAPHPASAPRFTTVLGPLVLNPPAKAAARRPGQLP